MRILLVEDERKVATFIERGLKEEYYTLDVVSDGEEGVYMAEVNSYDLIILDLMLPKKNGMDVCTELRKKKVDTPILMLTARDRTEDKVLGLEAGADDYLTKPFAFEELLARVRALIRRKNTNRSAVLKIDDLELNQLTHCVRRAGREISLDERIQPPGVSHAERRPYGNQDHDLRACMERELRYLHQCYRCVYQLPQEQD